MSTKADTRTKHTASPWTWLPDDGQFVVDARHKVIAEIPCQGGNPADGLLISAAPELLAACKQALSNANSYTVGMQRDEAPGFFRLVDILEAAIRKATGGDA